MSPLAGVLRLVAMLVAVFEVLDGLSYFRQRETIQSSAFMRIEAQRIGDARHECRRESPAHLAAFECFIPTWGDPGKPGDVFLSYTAAVSKIAGRSGKVVGVEAGSAGS